MSSNTLVIEMNLVLAIIRSYWLGLVVADLSTLLKANTGAIAIERVHLLQVVNEWMVLMIQSV